MLRVAPGETVRWTFGPASGEVQADARGCITIPRLKITAEPATLSVEKAKQANVSPSDAAIAGPGGLGFDEIVFVKRKPYSSDHYYTDINSGTSPDRFVADNGIYVYNLRTRSERAVVRTADMPGGKGFIGKISLSFDAKKAVFDFRQDPGAGFRIGKWVSTARACAKYRCRRPTRPRKRRDGTRAGTPTTSTPAICRTARSSSPRPAASTPCCAAGRPAW